MTSSYLIVYIHDLSHMLLAELAITIYCLDFGEIELRLMKMWPNESSNKPKHKYNPTFCCHYIEQMNIMIYDQ